VGIEIGRAEREKMGGGLAMSKARRKEVGM